MKWSNGILLSLLLVLFAGIVSSNLAIKKEFDKTDKNDPYWNYSKVLQQPFKYLKIDGGNFTNIIYEPGATCSVRILNDWQRYNPKLINTVIKNDTLFIRFIHLPKNPGERDWMSSKVLVRLFSPEILSVEGINTRFEMLKTSQKDLVVNMSGKSAFEMESLVPELGNLDVTQKDSSSVVFEMSPDYMASRSFHAKKVKADVKDHSLLDIGYAQADSLDLNIGDSSAILLSGSAVKRGH
jgi:hypothetical protein